MSGVCSPATRCPWRGVWCRNCPAVPWASCSATGFPTWPAGSTPGLRHRQGGEGPYVVEVLEVEHRRDDLIGPCATENVRVGPELAGDLLVGHGHRGVPEHAVAAPHRDPAVLAVDLH